MAFIVMVLIVATSFSDMHHPLFTYIILLEQLSDQKKGQTSCPAFPLLCLLQHANRVLIPAEPANDLLLWQSVHRHYFYYVI